MTPPSTSPLLPLVLGASLGLLLFVAVVFKRWRAVQRHQKSTALELTPNCLLTRIPVLLLTEIPESSSFEPTFHMLKEHGYKTDWVKIIQPFPEQIRELIQELKSENLQFHFFVSPQLKTDFLGIEKNYPPAKEVVSTFTFLNFTEPRQVLVRAVELAEQDFIESSQ